MKDEMKNVKKERNEYAFQLNCNVMYGWITYRLTERSTNQLTNKPTKQIGEVGREMEKKIKSNAFIMNHVIGTHLNSPLNQMREYKLKEQIPYLLNPGYHRHRKVQRLKEDKWKNMNEGVEAIQNKEGWEKNYKKNLPLEPPYMPKSLAHQECMNKAKRIGSPFHPSLFALSLMTP